ncbi:purine-cytosine permease family protein [Streptomyces sp. NPDC048297]|uniref:purine-cytosine permease family protein n=1 Tax=Streptomyces sp. NPDC048297 TaxID=3365531 RepID=UPI003715BD77
MSTANEARPGGVIETRSIDHVPASERHGKPWHQGPFWFTGNFVLVTMVSGFLGPAVGLSLGYTCLAIVLGVGFGTFFMAFHANQGPTMGLPQMIQSRAQFGSRGAIVPFAATVFVYVGFIVFDLVLATQALQTVLPGGPWFWYPFLMLVAVVLAVIGHDLLHWVQRWLTPVLLVFFGVFTVYAALHLGSTPTVAKTGWTLTGFLIMFSVSAGYQISYSVYVSDYSRYLPADTPARGVITWTYLGAGASAIWLMCLGALLGTHLEAPDAVASLVTVGNDVFSGFGTLLVLISVPALLSICAVNSYGAMLTSASAVDGFTPVRPGVRVRITGIAIVAVLSVAIALALPADYLGSFNNFVLLMLYFLIPWTAVNLADFYLVRRGHYAITELFNPNGMYGRWAWRGLTAYAVGLLAMIPFVSLSFYVGPVAEALGGVDIAFLVGLVVGSGLYYLLTRGLDLGEEAVRIEESNHELAELVSQGLAAPATTEHLGVEQ